MTRIPLKDEIPFYDFKRNAIKSWVGKDPYQIDDAHIAVVARSLDVVNVVSYHLSRQVAK